MPLQKISYSKGHQKTDSADAAVTTHSQKLEHRGVYEAHIRSAPTGSWHGNDNDPQEHLTVDFKKEDGSHITTHHVYRPEEPAAENKDQK
ncbi:hypothetical protein EYZ11_011738 [Aspergillus tanneri]|uniref:Uncharacterized protein n=1 Tax=Aspergillus tanneri TaxID=1220188 RepID=A0A4S3J206_9EURO|nr:uncharacterized protein ATNIH1004_011812 [Aspergillus tanneri]KAA8641676.1 hypothetical protein ATNIH1004_011812 [Aspergillus tanneri]THC88810.1 hypothetical protein EYZ11_011738 [Aspergillus tanneri]